MEQLTKRILAIVLVAVVGVGIGLTVWIFVSPYTWGSKDCPGAPAGIPANRIIKVGVIGDTERITGEGTLNGAWMAAHEINSAGGITVNGETYYFGLVSENSDEANPVFDSAVAVSAAQRLINYYQIEHVIGGFRSEAMAAYRDLFMEQAIIFINTGAAPSSWCQSVIDNYTIYKYFFQPNPINTTALAKELITLIMSTALVLNATLPYRVDRFSLMREDLIWTQGFKDAIVAVLTNITGTNPLWVMNYTGADIAFPQDVTPVEMESHWDTIDGNNTQIVIPIISGEAGLPFMQSYRTKQPGCVPIGINVASQDSEFWTISAGTCEYGVTLESVFETNKTANTIPFYNAYVANFSKSPMYTAVGSYDGIYQLAWAIEQGQSLLVDDIITQLEALDPSDNLVGAGGVGYYDDSHCVVEGWPYGVALATQWYNGTKRLVPGIGIYPSGAFNPLPIPPSGELTNMEPLRLPAWGIYQYT